MLAPGPQARYLRGDERQLRSYLGLQPLWEVLSARCAPAELDRIRLLLGPEALEYNSDLYEEALALADILREQVQAVCELADQAGPEGGVAGVRSAEFLSGAGRDLAEAQLLFLLREAREAQAGSGGSGGGGNAAEGGLEGRGQSGQLGALSRVVEGIDRFASSSTVQSMRRSRILSPSQDAAPLRSFAGQIHFSGEESGGSGAAEGPKGPGGASIVESGKGGSTPSSLMIGSTQSPSQLMKPAPPGPSEAPRRVRPLAAHHRKGPLLASDIAPLVGQIRALLRIEARELSHRVDKLRDLVSNSHRVAEVARRLQDERRAITQTLTQEEIQAFSDELKKRLGPEREADRPATPESAGEEVHLYLSRNAEGGALSSRPLTPQLDHRARPASSRARPVCSPATPAPRSGTRGISGGGAGQEYAPVDAFRPSTPKVLRAPPRLLDKLQ